MVSMGLIKWFVALGLSVGVQSQGTTVPANLPSFTSPTAASSPLFQASSDGTCGGEVTCAGSRFGRCCSSHGFCGTSIDYCGEGCQVGFGQCGDFVSSPASISIVTVVATSTVRVTDTITTTLVTVTGTLANTNTLTTTTKTAQSTATSKPSLTLPRTPNNCKTYDQIRDDDDCRTIATRNSLNLRDFYRLNPAINTGPSLPGPPFSGLFPPGGPAFCSPGRPLIDPLGLLCRIDCDDLWKGYYVCTSVSTRPGWGLLGG